MPLVSRRLNRFYDQRAASTRIDELVRTRAGAGSNGSYIIGQQQITEYSIMEETSPRFFKVVYKNTTEEAVFRLIGVVTSCAIDLPQRQLNEEELRHNAQHVAVSGLGSSSFKDSLDAIYKHHWQMRREADRNVKSPRITMHDNGQDVHFKCRLFTTGEDASTTDNVEPAPHVDRGGWIKYHTQDGLVRHSEDNRVFYERELEPDQCVPISPTSISTGDIVEIEFTMLGVPTLQGVVFLLVQSRVVVLDNKFELEASMKEYEHVRVGGVAPATQLKAKRRRDEDPALTSARKRFAQMAVSQGEEVEMRNGV